MDFSGAGWGWVSVGGSERVRGAGKEGRGEASHTKRRVRSCKAPRITTGQSSRTTQGGESANHQGVSG
ncbi:hypothetical protein E2C01_037410 [Portunus trituberculatus]|uniref:Uncharacterized protein n=1 Tax=Portunus trituberculatus TaxID=210409 RepID=A0A5B7FFJ5_PORTR|nr:hypothetical protein [Portunus trituberculatus]